MRVKPQRNGSGNGPEKKDNSRKIEALQSAVRNGKYSIESRKVAEKIIKDALREIRGRLR